MHKHPNKYHSQNPYIKCTHTHISCLCTSIGHVLTLVLNLIHETHKPLMFTFNPPTGRSQLSAGRSSRPQRCSQGDGHTYQYDIQIPCIPLYVSSPRPYHPPTTPTHSLYVCSLHPPQLQEEQYAAAVAVLKEQQEVRAIMHPNTYIPQPKAHISQPKTIYHYHKPKYHAQTATYHTQTPTYHTCK